MGAAAALGALISVAAFYPGTLNNDSAGQYTQALSGHYSGWHPPIMAWLWHAMQPVGIGQASLFILNSCLYWLGIWLVARDLQRKGQVVVAILVLLSAAFPLIAYQNRFIITDVGLASALTALFGLAFHCRTAEQRVPGWTWPLMILVGLYALLVRANAAFAVVPIALYALNLDARRRPVVYLGLWVSLTAAAFPATAFVNRHVLGSDDGHSLERLELYDLVGVATYSGDEQALRSLTATALPRLSSCYTPLFWDTLLTARCNNLWGSLHPSSGGRQAPSINAWWRSIVAHPLAYAEHRLRHYNLELLFLVPAAPQCLAAPEMHQCGAPGSAERRSVIRQDYLLKNFVAWPATWLAFGLALLLAAWRRTDAQSIAIRALLLSALAYGLSYILVGLATNVRYFHWTIVAVLLAALIDIGQNEITRRVWRLILIPTVAVIVLGYVFRLADLSFLIAA